MNERERRVWMMERREEEEKEKRGGREGVFELLTVAGRSRKQSTGKTTKHQTRPG